MLPNVIKSFNSDEEKEIPSIVEMVKSLLELQSDIEGESYIVLPLGLATSKWLPLSLRVARAER